MTASGPALLDPAVEADRLREMPAALLDWYGGAARDLPWRVGPQARAQGERPDAYAVWLSEIMLQQTTTAHAAPYFAAFLERFPTVADLAEAPEEEVMGMWAGLGYYSRARNLLRCARTLASDGFPKTVSELQKLPGIGPYTAGAIASIAFGERAAAIDGNVERVLARLCALSVPPRNAQAAVRELAGSLVPADRPGEYAEAVMDLGATICTPKSPSCLLCPVAGWCRAREAEGGPAGFPVKAPKKSKPVRTGRVRVVLSADGQRVATERRPPSGLLGGMLGLPTAGWDGTETALPSGSGRMIGRVTHVFTHFKLELDVEAETAPPQADWTHTAAALDALPTVFRKALELALAAPPPDS